MLRKLAFAGALCAFAASAFAAGQFGGLPTVPSATPLTGNELSPADTGLPGGQNPQTELLTTQQYRAATYGVYTPTTGTTVSASAASQLTYLNPAGTLAALTVVMPSAPVDGQRWKLFSTQAITALTVSAASGQTISAAYAAPTSLNADGSAIFIWQGATNSWLREG